jgi:hypothetical protein
MWKVLEGQGVWRCGRFWRVRVCSHVGGSERRMCGHMESSGGSGCVEMWKVLDSESGFRRPSPATCPIHQIKEQW